MTIQELLIQAQKQLEANGQIEGQSWLEAEALLAKAAKQDKAWLISHGAEQARLPLQKTAKNLLKRRLKGEPLAYLLGSAIFCQREFLVSKHVLIPRPETEELVEHALNDLKHMSNNTLVWDVGVGSGAIAISIAIQGANIIASDRSKTALTMAKKNAKRLISSKLKPPNFYQGSLLAANIKKAIQKHQPDQLLILANLPYLPNSDKQALSPSVTKYEPHSALFSGEDGLTLIRIFLKQLHEWPFFKTISAEVYFEFDPPQAAMLETLARSYFPNASISILKDQCGHDRFLRLITPTK